MAFILFWSSVRAACAAAVQLLPLAHLFWALLLNSRHFPPCLSACGFGRYCVFWGDGFGGNLLRLGAYFKLPLAPIVSAVLLPTLGRPVDCYLMLLLV